MGKYIFLTGYYLPKPGATGLCIHQLAKETARRGHDVTTICYSDGDNRSVFDGVKIVKIPIPSFLQENMSDLKLAREINQIRSIWSKLVHIKDYPLRSNRLVKTYYSSLKNLVAVGDDFTIVASVNPLEAVIATDLIKKEFPSKVTTYYYCADTLSNEKGNSGILPAEYRTKHGLKWEKKLFASFDAVFIMECHKEHYFSKEFSEYMSKMKIANFPLFSRIETCDQQLDNEFISFVYAGTLYKELRNPQLLCDLLVKISQMEKIDVRFLGSGDCDDILENATKRSNGAIRYLGMQPHNVAMQELGRADVLLSIGNAESPMAPSKIYEYMSTGKPIVHTYTYEKDPCLEPLNKYGNALLIREGEKHAAEKLLDFIKNRKNISLDEVKGKFILSTPEYTVDVIESKSSEGKLDGRNTASLVCE